MNLVTGSEPGHPELVREDTFEIEAASPIEESRLRINRELGKITHASGCELLRRMGIDISPEMEADARPRAEDEPGYTEWAERLNDLGFVGEYLTRGLQQWGNELLHNALDHGFEDGIERAQLSLRTLDNDTFQMELSGTGTLPEDYSAMVEKGRAIFERADRATQLEIADMMSELGSAAKKQGLTVEDARREIEWLGEYNDSERGRGVGLTFYGVPLDQIEHENAIEGVHGGFVRLTVTFAQAREALLDSQAGGARASRS